MCNYSVQEQSGEEMLEPIVRERRLRKLGTSREGVTKEQPNKCYIGCLKTEENEVSFALPGKTQSTKTSRKDRLSTKQCH